jgi:serine/threonine-protein kinase
MIGMAQTKTPDTTTPMTEAQRILCPFCHKPNVRRARFCQECGRDVILNNNGPRRYVITRIIKKGGQGAVYETIGDDNKIYAVKELLDRFVDPKERAEAIEHFGEEARLLENLKHPSIPRVHAHFKDEGRQYLAMDFVNGEDLEEILKRAGALAEPKVLEWADQICNVLAHLHDRGLIYRDMKPSNIMIEHETGNVKLIDFGIAQVFQPTGRGAQIGTPGYAPPEQYQGIATVQSDIYALGATLHHMLTGRDPRDEAPFSFPPIRELKPTVSQRTADAIARALQMKPEERYRSAPEFRASLRRLAAHPAQVRRAPAPVVQPQQLAARPAGSVAVQPAPGAQAPAHTGDSVAPSIPQTMPQQPARKKPGFFGRLFALIRTLLSLVFVLALIGVALYFAFPDLVAEYWPLVEPYLPDAMPMIPGFTPG